MATPKLIVVGLGNPGPKYASTRHNIGFRVVDALAQARGLRWRRFPWLSPLAWVAEGGPMILTKPRTFMNRSGIAIRSLCRRYRVEPMNVLAVYDDADLELGRMRLRKSGGSGGHNGVRSLAWELETDEFPRIRLGVRGAGRGTSDLAEYLLSDFDDAEQEAVRSMLALAGKALETAVEQGVESAMNRFNKRGTP
jgi:PTH1 family peptidyl-tRNA hydrolase